MLAACTSAPATPAPANPTVTLIPQAAAPPCDSIPTAPTPAADAPSLIPPVSAADHIRGREDAAVTFLVYGDLQDGTSALFAGVMQRLITDYPNDVRYVSRVFPLVGRNDKALLAAQAVEAASRQGKFWEMHDLLYAQQANWVNLPPEDFEQWSAAQASALGMDVERYQAEVKSEAVIQQVQDNFETARQFGPFAVPLILINSEIYLGPQDYGSLRDIVELILLGRRQFTECPPFFVEKTRQYLATLHTEKGDVVIQLFADKAPFTVNSFVFLARSGWYDNITFHRVIPDLYVQTGDPSGTGKGTPGYYVMTEILPDLKFDKPGMVAMVNSGPDTSGSQFFITLAPAPEFDGRYTIFGEVLSGMEVLRMLTPRNAQPGVETLPGDKLLSIEIEEK
ncbi:MAG: peptidylprolyl isomerase [Chloroflexota bacterium]|nr:peptidylprolyl isomerase [Chloroflexota bacterium]MBI5703491.1 peptidylprolyl isomerase [Chloroflexota bacterium]